MATINRDVFITQFREEVSDHLRGITRRLFQLEEQPGDQRQLIDEIFRIAHTLKGSARMMGYHDISALAHKMEDLLVEIRDGHLDLNSAVMDLLFYCLDTVTYLVEGIAKNVKRTADLDQFTRLFSDLLAGKSIEVPQLQTQPGKPDLTEPAPESSPAKLAPETVLEAEDHQYVRIHTKDLDAMLNLVGEVIINQYRYDGQRAAYRDIVQELREHRQNLATLQELLRDGQGNLSQTRVSRLSNAVDASAERVLRQAMGLLKRMRTDGQQMHLAVDKLQEQVIDIRMVPASRIFHLFPRMVRMTARRLGKVVDLQILGEDTTIDSRIIEEMRDPLLHLIQNAIHHGIEMPEKRQGYGKPPGGTITISAKQEGNRIVIKVQDDGQGIALKQVKEMALQEGLLSHRHVNSVNSQDLFELIFHPGFSTSDTVDDIAGRGFGLNIVRAHVDRVQGEIEVRSQSGKGAEFIIKLPLTLTIIDALLVRVADQIFAIPTIAVEKTFDITPSNMSQLGRMPVVEFDGTLLPVVELQELLCVPASEQSADEPSGKAHRTVLVIQAEDRRIGFLVDDLVEEREIVIKSLGSCLKRVKNVAGATAVRGEIVILLYVRDLVRSADALLSGRFMPDITASHGHQRPFSSERPIVPRILLVDDSANAREVERLILEEAGYEVLTAEDGKQALQALEKFSVDLVITDLEMPHMGGLELTKTIKQQEQLADIPVIIVSTRAADSDKSRGKAVGAQAYIAKGEFHEKTFLQAVDACLTR